MFFKNPLESMKMKKGWLMKVNVIDVNEVRTVGVSLAENWCL